MFHETRDYSSIKTTRNLQKGPIEKYVSHRLDGPDPSPFLNLLLFFSAVALL